MIRMMKSRGMVRAEVWDVEVEGKCMQGFSGENAGKETTLKTHL
jgi:hypothetical protein